MGRKDGRKERERRGESAREGIGQFRTLISGQLHPAVIIVVTAPRATLMTLLWCRELWKLGLEEEEA